jgi:hypothetical protein
MAGQAIWGNSGDSTNSYIVNPKRAKEIYYNATWRTLVSKLTGGAKMEKQQLRFGKKLETVHIGNSSCIWETEITSGNEERLTMVEHRDGMPSGYGDYANQTGNYDKYKHTRVWINQIDSTADPVPGRCSIKQVKDILNDPKSILQKGQKMWAGQEVDFEFIRACLMGASRNLLLTTKGGTGISLYNASAGETRSCYNFYVPETGLVTPSTTRATHETNVGTALSTLADNSIYAFDLGEHNKLGDIWSNLYGEAPTVGGKQYFSVWLMDPWLVHRLAVTGGQYDTLMREAHARGAKNPAIDHMAPIVLDEVLYIPYQPLKAFRASVSAGAPVYGPGISTDPRPQIAANTQKICLGICMGPGAMLRATDRMMWSTAALVDPHKQNYNYALHWDDGFVRNEYGAEDGRTELENKKMIVGAWYDPGPEVPFAA